MILYNLIKDQFEKYYNQFQLKTIFNNPYKIQKNDLDSEVFRLKDGKIIYKSLLIKAKNDFQKEYNDYLSNRMSDKNEKKEIIQLLTNYISDKIFIYWSKMDINEKLLVYDLIYQFISVQNNKQKTIKKLMFEMIKLYSILIIYSFLYYSFVEFDIEIYNKFINDIQLDELELLNLFNSLLVEPHQINNQINHYFDHFNMIKSNIIDNVNNENILIIEKSKKLYQRIIDNEISHFNSLVILNRFDIEKFDDWIKILKDKRMKYPQNLFDES